MLERNQKSSRLPWLLRALWNPVDAFDLYDTAGLPDHEKLVPTCFLLIACLLHALHNPFTWYELLALGSLSFGYQAWRMFLKSKSVTGTIGETIANETKTINTNTTTTVRIERDPASGIDPA